MTSETEIIERLDRIENKIDDMKTPGINKIFTLLSLSIALFALSLNPYLSQADRGNMAITAFVVILITTVSVFYETAITILHLRRMARSRKK